MRFVSTYFYRLHALKHMHTTPQSITLAVSPSRKLIATACKATSPEHAVVRVYETSTFKLVGQPLAGHTLTVTRVAFSPDDRFVLSVSRDRTWHLFEAKDDKGSNESILLTVKESFLTMLSFQDMHLSRPISLMLVSFGIVLGLPKATFL